MHWLLYLFFMYKKLILKCFLWIDVWIFFSYATFFSQLFSFARTTGLCFYMCKNKILLNCFLRKDDCIFFFHGQRPKTSSKLFPMQRRLNLFSCAKNYSIFYAKTTGSTPQRTAWPWPSSSTSSPGTSGGTRPKCIQAGHLIILLKSFVIINLKPFIYFKNYF